MKQVILLITTFLFVQCEILDSSDVDENSTFLERFDGVGFSDNNPEGENVTYFLMTIFL